jgi:hypothetical protein
MSQWPKSNYHQIHSLKSEDIPIKHVLDSECGDIPSPELGRRVERSAVARARSTPRQVVGVISASHLVP